MSNENKNELWDSKIEDIKNVPGIGDSKFQNMKEKLSV